MRKPKIELYRDNFQNYKRYGIPKAQLVIADIPYNIGTDAYGSNPMWYNGGDNKNGESKLAKSSFFNTDGYFKIAVRAAVLPCGRPMSWGETAMGLRLTGLFMAGRRKR